MRESLNSRLKVDLIIQVVAENDQMNVKHRVDDSTNILCLHRTTDNG